MSILISALILGFILSLLALGVLISFRLFSFADLSVEGTFPLGGAIAASLIVSKTNPFLSNFIVMLAGGVAGAITGILYTRYKIDKLLSGILIMTGLYSVNLHIMKKSNIPLMESTTVFTYLANIQKKYFVWIETFIKPDSGLLASDVFILIITIFSISLICILIYLFFKTNIGTIMRATGNNPQMVKSLGGNTDLMIVLGLAISNSLISLSGALLAQYQGFADVQMGLGMLVWGIASLIIGESLIKNKSLGILIAATVMGSILFRLLVAIVLRWGMNPNDLKIITAVFVFAALILPAFIEKIRNRNKLVPQEIYATPKDKN